jgi:protein LTV1
VCVGSVMLQLTRFKDEAWDCETIVSTYSNLDNHPSRISALQKPGRKDIPQNSHGASNLKGPIVFLRRKQQIPMDSCDICINNTLADCKFKVLR